MTKLWSKQEVVHHFVPVQGLHAKKQRQHRLLEGRVLQRPHQAMVEGVGYQPSLLASVEWKHCNGGVGCPK
jgi:hypothetical protein